MNLKERIKIDLHDARKDKNVVKRMVLSVLLGELEQIGSKVDNEATLGLIRKLIKSNTMIMDNLDINKSENVDKYNTLQTENKYLDSYLPSLLSEPQLLKIIQDAIFKNGFSTMKDMGRVMNILANDFPKLYDGRLASNLVKQELNR